MLCRSVNKYLLLLFLLGGCRGVTIVVSVPGSRCGQWILECVISVKGPQEDLCHVVMGARSCSSNYPVSVGWEEDWRYWKGLPCVY